MARVPTMEFKRGDGVTHTLKIPIANYHVGATLFFAAKEEVDNDSTDALAVINKTFGDSNVSLVTDPLYATYTLTFLPADITGVTFEDGESVKKYLGEFQYIVPGNSPISFPADNEYIQVLIYADVKRAIT